MQHRAPPYTAPKNKGLTAPTLKAFLLNVYLGGWAGPPVLTPGALAGGGGALGVQ